jgi:HAD superfamily hydrolase (TIGR01509 family)
MLPKAPPSPLRIDTVIFDLDGTLVDTELAAAKAIARTFAEWKVQISQEDAAYITGRTWEKAAEHLALRYPLPVPAAQACEIMIEAYRQALDTDLAIVPGGAEAVSSLAQAGIPLALVSGSRRQDIFYSLDRLKLRQYFPVVLGAEDYPHSKPAPDGYLKALELLGRRDPKRTLVFEDSEPGIASALAAGCWVVAISGTNHFNQNTTRAHASIVDLTSVSADWLASLSFTRSS